MPMSMEKLRSRHIGNKYGKLTIIEIGDLTPDGKHREMICQCDCGAIKEVRIDMLKSGNIKSCGCNAHPKKTSHHDLYKDVYPRLFKIYSGMVRRCYNKKASHYEYYGGRGISIFEDWLGDNGLDNFMEWSLNNGYLNTLSIDRIDVNGNYTPFNCRWATIEEQSHNKRTRKGNTTGVSGVIYDNKRNKYRASISCKSKRIYLGAFDTLKEAIQIRKEAEQKYWNSD